MLVGETTESVVVVVDKRAANFRNTVPASHMRSVGHIYSIHPTVMMDSTRPPRARKNVIVAFNHIVVVAAASVAIDGGGSGRSGAGATITRTTVATAATASPVVVTIVLGLEL